MIGVFSHSKNFSQKLTALLTTFIFLSTTLFPASLLAQNQMMLPAPGIMVGISPAFSPVILKGVKVHPENPFRFDFIVDSGDSDLTGEALTEQTTTLVKYFLASIAIPEQDLWVNLSPFEKNRIIEDRFALTDMGRDLLAQDYILKQITASLVYPEDEVGEKFWNTIYQKAAQQLGTTDIPVNTFNKVWILPEVGNVYQNNNTALVSSGRMKVLLEEDFMALNEDAKNSAMGIQLNDEKVSEASALSSQIIRDIVIPILEKEVNEGENFATLRQIYQSHVLAMWYKQTLKNSIVNRVYSNSSKVAGIDIDDKNAKAKIYDQYIEAFNKGVYDYIKEDIDPISQKIIPRKYFSGGTKLLGKVNVFSSESAIQPSAAILAGLEPEGASSAVVYELYLENSYVSNTQPEPSRRHIHVAMKDISSEDSGALTGHNSKKLAKDVGATDVVIGAPQGNPGAALSGEDLRDVTLKIAKAIETGKGDDPLRSILMIKKNMFDGDQEGLDDYVAAQVQGFIKNPEAIQDAIFVYDAQGSWDAHSGLTNFQQYRKILQQAISDSLNLEEGFQPNMYLGLNDSELQFVKTEYAVDGIYLKPERFKQALNNEDISSIFDTFGKLQDLTENTILDFSSIYGADLVEKLALLPGQWTNGNPLPTVVTSNLDLRRAGDLLAEKDLDQAEPLEKPSNVHFATQSLEDITPEYLEALKQDGATYVLLHHSERRRFHGVTIEQAAEQAINVFEAGLIPVVAIGELERDKDGKWKEDLQKQVRTVLNKFDPKMLSHVRAPRFAYEPISAIGSGQSMSTIDVAEANQIINETINAYLETNKVSLKQRVKTLLALLYGGSVKPSSIYGLSGALERLGKIPEKLRRMKPVAGGLIGTRGQIPQDLGKIVERSNENALAKGKPIRGESGANWKMNIHTLKDAIRRLDRYTRDMAKDGKQWQGETYIAVHPSMIASLVQRYRGKNAPTNIGTLDRTERQQAIAAVIDKFWTWWENEGIQTNPEAMQIALDGFKKIYNQQKLIKKMGVTWYEIYNTAILSELFRDEWSDIPAAQLLAKLRFSPVDHVLEHANIQKMFKNDRNNEKNSAKLKKDIRDVYKKKRYFSELAEEEQDKLFRLLSQTFNLGEYGEVVVSNVDNQVSEQSLTVAKVEAKLQVNKDVLMNYGEKIDSNNVLGVVHSLWNIRDVMVWARANQNTNLLYEALEIFNSAQEYYSKKTDQLIQRSLKAIDEELNAPFIKNLEELRRLSTQLSDLVDGDGEFQRKRQELRDKARVHIDAMKSKLGIYNFTNSSMNRLWRDIQDIATPFGNISEKHQLKRAIDIYSAINPNRDWEESMAQKNPRATMLKVISRLTEMAQINSNSEQLNYLEQLVDVLNSRETGAEILNEVNIDSDFVLRELPQLEGISQESEIALLDQVRDMLALERNPQNFVLTPDAEIDALLEEVNYARIWGGMQNYLIKKVSDIADAQNSSQEDSVVKPKELEPARAIQSDRKDPAYVQQVKKPIKVSLDVNRIHEADTDLALRLSADNFIRRMLGDRQGQGFNPNYDLQEISGFRNVDEIQKFINFVNVNPYHQKAQFVLELENEDKSSAWRLLATNKFGEKREIKIALGRSANIPKDQQQIVITNEDPDDVIRGATLEVNKRLHVINPLLDATVNRRGVWKHKTSVSEALSNFLSVLDDAYKVESAPFRFTTPGERHNLLLLDKQAGRGIDWEGRNPSIQVQGQPRWETHAQLGAGFAQVYVTFPEGVTVDKDEILKQLKYARQIGKPVYFANGWVPNSISVQAHDLPYVVDTEMVVQKGRTVTFNLWIPDWTQTEAVLDSILEKKSRNFVPPDVILQESYNAETSVPTKNIAIHGADEIVAVAMLKQLRGQSNVAVRSLYIEESTANPLDTDMFVKYLRQMMPDSTIRLSPSGDAITINNSSEIRVHIGKKKTPDWRADGVETVVLAKRWTEKNTETAEDHKANGAKTVVFAADPNQAEDVVVDAVKGLFDRNQIFGEVVQTHAALDPYRSRGHDIVVGDQIQPAPFANLVTEPSAVNRSKLGASNYDTNFTTVHLALAEELSKNEVLENLYNDRNFALLYPDQDFKPSHFRGESQLYVHPDHVFVDGKTVTIMVGYDFTHVWAKDALDNVMAGRSTNVLPKQAAKKQKKSKPEDAEKLAKEKVVDTIPAPKPRPKREMLDGQERPMRLGVDLSDVPFNDRKRESSDAFVDSLVDVLMGDESVMLSLYGVKDLKALERRIKIRLPKHLSVSIDALKTEDYESYTETVLRIEGSEIPIFKNSVSPDEKLDKAFVVVNDSLKDADNAAWNKFEALGESASFKVSPVVVDAEQFAKAESLFGSLEDVLNESFNDVIQKSGSWTITSAARVTEADVSVVNAEIGKALYVETPSRLEGQRHEYTLAFNKKVTLEQVRKMVRQLVKDNEDFDVQLFEERRIHSIDLVGNTKDLVISLSDIKGSGRLWSIPVWTSETGLAQSLINESVQEAVESDEGLKADEDSSFLDDQEDASLGAENVDEVKVEAPKKSWWKRLLPSYSRIVAKVLDEDLKGKMADVIISAIGGESGKAMLLGAIGNPNLNVLGVTMNRPDEAKVRTTIESMNNSTNYGRPGIRFDYGGYDYETGNYVMWAGSDETGWTRIDIFDGSQPKSIPIRQWLANGLKPIYLHMAGSGYHRFKEKDWTDQGARIVYGNPGKGGSLKLIPVGVNWKDTELIKSVMGEDIYCQGSCTTGAAIGALTTISKLIYHVSGITLHEFTNDQNISPLLHEIIERSFAAAEVTSKSTSGAGAVVGDVLPALAGLSAANALREGNGGASVYSATVYVQPELREETTLEGLKEMYRAFAKQYPNIIGVHEGAYPLDSELVKGATYSAYIDLTTLRYNKDTGVIMLDSWYDNVIGFSTRMSEVTAVEITKILKADSVNDDYNSANNVTAAASSAPGTSNSYGGIFLGGDEYLNITDYTEEGTPVFDAQQIQEFELNFEGFIPVPILAPMPANILTLSGLPSLPSSRHAGDKTPQSTEEFSAVDVRGRSTRELLAQVD